MQAGIYALTNKRNGKQYVGRSVNLEKRKTTHLWALEKGRHDNKHLQRAWNKGDRFEFEILELCERNVLNEREIYWIDKLDTFREGYNQCAGGAATLGRKCSDETKEKISKANKGKKVSQKTIDKRRESLKARLDADPEFYKKYHANRARSASRHPWNKGRPHTDEEKQNLREKLKGRTVSDEQKQKLRELYSGEKSLSAKITERDVVNIRRRFLMGESQASISRDYLQITKQTIFDIVRARRWKSVPNTLEELEAYV